MSLTEHQEQAIFVQWFRFQYPGIIIFAVPNGDYRNITTANRLKKEGVLAGVPDLVILLDSGKVLFVEMKRIGGRLSDNQKSTIKKMESLNHQVIVAFGADDAIEKVREIIK